MVRSWLSLVLLLGLVCPAGATYLEQETLILDMTGSRELRTSRPLEEHKQYHLTMKSLYNLRPIWGALRECNCVKYLLLLDGQSPSDHDRLGPWHYDRDLTEVTWRWWGKGMPLSLRLAKDLTSDIRHATVEVSLVKNDEPAPTPAVVKVSSMVAPRETTAGDGVLERAVFAMPVTGAQIKTALPLQLHRSYDIKLRAPHNLGLLCGKPHWDLFALRLSDQVSQRRDVPACALARDVDEIILRYTGQGIPLLLQMTQDVSEVLPQVSVEISPTPEPEPVPEPVSRIPAPLVWCAAGAGIVLCWRLIVIIRRTLRHEPFSWELEPSQPVVSRRALPPGNAELDEAREELARARRDAQRAHQEAAQARQDIEQARQNATRFRHEQDEVQRCAKVLAHWAELESNFLQPDFQQHYAAKHLRKILETDKDTWFQEAKRVRDDEPLRLLLERDYPQVLQVLEARLEMIRMAERLDVTPPPEKPRLTPEDHHRKVTNFRNRVLQWRQTKAEDFIAQRVQQLEMLHAFEEELAQYDLDEDERDRLLQEFRQELDLIEPPKPKSKPDDDKEHPDDGFATLRPDR